MSTAEQEPVAGASGLAEVTMRLTEIRNRREEEEQRHTERMAALEAEKAEAERHRDLILAGATLDIVRIAENFLDVYNPANASVGEGGRALGCAIQDLALGAPKLRRDRVATKNYDRWRGQYIGWIDYWMGPRHGNIIFAIGLKEEYRDHPPNGVLRKELTQEPLDAGIAYLHALRKAA